MIELEQKRHAQWIIAIDLEYCMKFFKPGFNAVSLEDFIKGVPAHRLIEKGVEVKTIHYQDDLASRTMLRERHRLEFDKNFLQPLNYLVLKQSLLTQKHDISGSTWDDFFSTYYRKKGGVNRDSKTRCQSAGVGTPTGTWWRGISMTRS